MQTDRRRLFAYEPKPNPQNCLEFGHARFTLFTDRFLRMEWAVDREFINLASFMAANRHLPGVSYSKTIKGGRLELDTGALRLHYTEDGKPFSPANLEISFSGGSDTVTWKPGRKNAGNLMGTIRTLDRCDGELFRPENSRLAKRINLGPGLLSQEGWSLIDDSGTILLTPRGDRHWFETRSKNHKKDLYFLAYGHHYKEALRDAARVFGRIPLPPRYTLGLWWSRYWPYTDKDLEGLIREFEQMGVPLDVLVIDMDWHLPGWTGYTWNRDYFPDPKESLGWIKSRDLRVTLNLHPADGVGRHEEMFADMARVLNLDPGSSERIPFDCTDPKFMEAYFRLLHHPKEEEGVDFWWLDWQQGTSSAVAGLDPLPWLNIQHWEDMEARGDDRRPLIFSRYGGIGSGRYPVGFSGDTFSTWESLAYQPYFTATAANVLYGYWSHDIGGHDPGDIDPELFTRWVQLGSYSPIFRTHATKNPKVRRKIWEYGEPYFSIMKEAILRRYQRIPYIYTENRKGVDSGLCLCRPLYHEWPKEEEAFRATGQYLFGERLLAAPITEPLDPAVDMAGTSIWLPPGEWIDTATGQHFAEGGWINRHYLLSEIPVFVRPGTILPGQSDARRLSFQSYRDLLVELWPGEKGSYELYEDDGETRGYLRGEGAWIELSHRREGPTRNVEVRLARGEYPALALNKSLEVRLYDCAPPKSIELNGHDLPWSYRLERTGWSYVGEAALLLIRLPSFEVSPGVRLRILENEHIPAHSASGLAGLFSRLEYLRTLTTLVTSFHPLQPDQSLPVRAAQTGNLISRNPSRYLQELAALKDLLERFDQFLPEMKRNLTKRESNRQDKQAHLEKAQKIWMFTQREFARTIENLGVH